jgi:hypothetical protein
MHEYYKWNKESVTCSILQTLMNVQHTADFCYLPGNVHSSTCVLRICSVISPSSSNNYFTNRCAFFNMWQFVLFTHQVQGCSYYQGNNIKTHWIRVASSGTIIKKSGKPVFSFELQSVTIVEMLKLQIHCPPETLTSKTCINDRTVAQIKNLQHFACILHRQEESECGNRKYCYNTRNSDIQTNII